MPPLVSIIIPCHNYGRFLAEAIDSALEQCHGNVEVIVINDGSTDDTDTVARRYGDRIRYHATANRGHGATLNFGLSLARGDYYVPLDADNRLHPAFIERTLAVLHAATDPAVAYVYTHRQLFGLRSGVARSKPYDLAALKQRNYIDMCALTCTRVWRDIPYDETRAMRRALDYDFYLTLAEHGYRGQLLDDILIDYRMHGASCSTAIRSRHDQVAVCRTILRKHHQSFSRAERRSALAEARNRTLISVIESRNACQPRATRLRDLLALIRIHAPVPQLWNQCRHLLSPRRSETSVPVPS